MIRLGVNTSTFERDLAQGFTVNAEGQALVSVLEDGIEKVKPSAGASGEKFVGFSWNETIVPSMSSKVENLVADADGKLKLAKTPITGQLLVKDLTTGTVLSAGDPSSTADAYSISGDTITVHSSRVGHNFYVAYRYALTVEEAQMLYGSNPINSGAPALFSRTGIIYQGEVYIDQYDVTTDWSNVSDVKLGANGIITGSGSGETIDARVIKVPTSDDPTLGLYIR